MKNLFDVSGKVAVVTGGSRGIGAMIARGFVENGVKTYITARKEDELNATAEALGEFGECIALPSNLGTQEGVIAFAHAIMEREEQLHILVNNAGATWGAPIDEFPESGWDKVMDINVKGPFFLTQALLPLLEKAASAEDPARIINVGSIDGLNVNKMGTYSYGPSKAAIHHLTRTFASHLADRHITANAIAPGPFPSKMTAGVAKKFGEEIRKNVPLKRWGEPEDMAGAAIYLASKAGAYVSGAVIPVDGGIVASSRTL